MSGDDIRYLCWDCQTIIRGSTYDIQEAPKLECHLCGNLLEVFWRHE